MAPKYRFTFVPPGYLNYTFSPAEKTQITKWHRWNPNDVDTWYGYITFAQNWRNQPGNTNHGQAVRAWKDLSGSERATWTQTGRAQRARATSQTARTLFKQDNPALPRPTGLTYLRDEWTYWSGLPADQRLPYVHWVGRLVGDEARMTAGQRMAEWERNHHNHILPSMNDWPEYGNDLIGDIADYTIEDARQEATRKAGLNEVAQREAEEHEAERREAERREAEEERARPIEVIPNLSREIYHEPDTDEDRIYKVSRDRQKVDEDLEWRFFGNLHHFQDVTWQTSAMLYVGVDAEGFARDRIVVKGMWETAEERGRKLWEDRQLLYTSFPNSVNLAEQRYHKYAKVWIKVNEVLEQFYGAVAYIEYYSSGDLNSVMERYGVDADEIAQIPEAFVWVVFRSMANALFTLEFGHEHGGVPINNWVPLRHRDIKLENVFLGEPKQDLFPAYPYPVLGDFDVALRMDPNDENYKAAKGPGLEPGTDGWRAPEDLHKIGKPQPSLKADVWAVGLVIWSLMNSRKGIKWLENHRVSSTVGERLKEFKGPSFSWPEDSDPENPTVYYTTPLRDLVDDCLQLDPDDRPTATVLLRRVNKGLQMARRIQGDFKNLTSDQIGAHIRLSYQPDQYSLGRTYDVKRRKDINTYNSSDPDSDDQDGGSDGGGTRRDDEPGDDRVWDADAEMDRWGL